MKLEKQNGARLVVEFELHMHLELGKARKKKEEKLSLKYFKLTYM